MKRPFFSLSAPFWATLLVLTIVFGGICALPSLARSFSVPSGLFNFGNQTFVLNHEVLHFLNGFSRSPDGQHVARLTNRSVNQSMTRAAAILIDNPSGSGIFFYVVGAARVKGRESYSSPVFVGDRIKIEAVHVSAEIVTVHYLDHPANVPLGLPPTKPVTVTYTIQGDGSLH